MPASQFDAARADRFVSAKWDDDIVQRLVEYIRIPNKSPAFDPDWAAHGYMDEAVALFEHWARAKLPSLPGATLEVVPGVRHFTPEDAPRPVADAIAALLQR